MEGRKGWSILRSKAGKDGSEATAAEAEAQGRELTELEKALAKASESEEKADAEKPKSRATVVAEAAKQASAKKKAAAKAKAKAKAEAAKKVPKGVQTLKVPFQRWDDFEEPIREKVKVFSWDKKQGEYCPQKDKEGKHLPETLCILEYFNEEKEKLMRIPVRSPEVGKVVKHLHDQGAIIMTGDDLVKYDVGAIKPKVRPEDLVTVNLPDFGEDNPNATVISIEIDKKGEAMFHEIVMTVRVGTEDVGIRAPGDGIVTSMLKKKGDVVTIGEELFTMELYPKLDDEECVVCGGLGCSRCGGSGKTVKAEEYERLREVFNKYDQDCSGTIDLEELQVMCRELGGVLTQQQAEDAMKELDTDNTGSIDFNEFLGFWNVTPGLGGEENFKVRMMKMKLKAELGREKKKAQNAEGKKERERQRLREMFDKYDIDGSGSIDVYELKEMCTELGGILTDEQAEEAMLKLDSDNTGSINFENFLEFWNNSPGLGGPSGLAMKAMKLKMQADMKRKTLMGKSKTSKEEDEADLERRRSRRRTTRRTYVPEEEREPSEATVDEDAIKIIEVPDFGEISDGAVTEGTLELWDKDPHVFVEEGEIIAKIATSIGPIYVRAPADGCVTERPVEVGAVVKPGETLFTFLVGGSAVEKEKETMPVEVCVGCGGKGCSLCRRKKERRGGIRQTKEHIHGGDACLVCGGKGCPLCKGLEYRGPCKICGGKGCASCSVRDKRRNAITTCFFCNGAGCEKCVHSEKRRKGILQDSWRDSGWQEELAERQEANDEMQEDLEFIEPAKPEPFEVTFEMPGPLGLEFVPGPLSRGRWVIAESHNTGAVVPGDVLIRIGDFDLARNESEGVAEANYVREMLRQQERPLTLEFLPSGHGPPEGVDGKLFVASQRGGRTGMTIVNLALREHANVSAQGGHGWQPIHVAARNGYADVVALLLEKRAFVDAQTDRGRTPLHLACAGGHWKVVSLFLRWGAHVNICGDDGEYPIHAAARSGSYDVIDQVLQVAIDDDAGGISSRCQNGRMPLHLAAAFGHVDLVMLCLERQVSVLVLDYNGMLPVQLAAEGGHTEVVHVLTAAATKEAADLNWECIEQCATAAKSKPKAKAKQATKKIKLGTDDEKSADEQDDEYEDTQGSDARSGPTKGTPGTSVMREPNDGPFADGLPKEKVANPRDPKSRAEKAVVMLTAQKTELASQLAEMKGKYNNMYFKQSELVHARNALQDMVQNSNKTEFEQDKRIRQLERRLKEMQDKYQHIENLYPPLASAPNDLDEILERDLQPGDVVNVPVMCLRWAAENLKAKDLYGQGLADTEAVFPLVDHLQRGGETMGLHQPLDIVVYDNRLWCLSGRRFVALLLFQQLHRDQRVTADCIVRSISKEVKKQLDWQTGKIDGVVHSVGRQGLGVGQWWQATEHFGTEHTNQSELLAANISHMDADVTEDASQELAAEHLENLDVLATRLAALQAGHYESYDGLKDQSFVRRGTHRRLQQTEVVNPPPTTQSRGQDTTLHPDKEASKTPGGKTVDAPMLNFLGSGSQTVRIDDLRKREQVLDKQVESDPLMLDMWNSGKRAMVLCDKVIKQKPRGDARRHLHWM